MEKLDRIKLMMSYQMGKTLNENMEIGEGAGEFGLARDLSSATRDSQKIAHMGQFFKVGEDVVKMAKAKDLTTLSKDFKIAVKADLKHGFKSGGADVLGPASKIVAKQKAINEILSSGKDLSEGDINAIIERVKRETKAEFKKEERKFLGKATQTVPTRSTGKPHPGTSTGRILDKIKTLSPKIKNKLMPLKRLLSAKWLIILGLIGGGAYLLLRKKHPELTDEEIASSQLPQCLLDIMDDDSCAIEVTTAGDPVIYLKTTGVEEYDSQGGLKFHIDGTLTNGNGTKKGKWSCKEQVQENGTLFSIGMMILNEQSLDLNANEVSQKEMINYVDTAVDDLDGFVGIKNLQSLKNILTALNGKTYKGNPAINAFLDYYRQYEGETFVDDVNSVGVKTLRIPGIELKKEILDLIGIGTAVSNVEAGRDGDGNPATGVGGFNITWEEGGTTPVNPNPRNRKYVPCANFPFQYGCKNDKIREIQICLGMEPRYQTGNFGPITTEKLKENGYDASNGITQELYTLIMKRCAEKNHPPKLNLNPPVPYSPQVKPDVIPRFKPAVEPTVKSDVIPRFKPAVEPTAKQDTIPVPNQVEKPAGKLKNNLKDIIKQGGKGLSTQSSIR